MLYFYNQINLFIRLFLGIQYQSSNMFVPFFLMYKKFSFIEIKFCKLQKIHFYSINNSRIKLENWIT